VNEQALRYAALELFEEALKERARERILEKVPGAANADRAVAGLTMVRTLAPGWYDRVSYFLDLDERIKLGLGPESLLGAEVECLRVLARARAEFQREHPACIHCGELQLERFAEQCFGCGKNPRKAEAA
jgi:hypothetical protein